MRGSPRGSLPSASCRGTPLSTVANLRRRRCERADWLDEDIRASLSQGAHKASGVVESALGFGSRSALRIELALEFLYPPLELAALGAKTLRIGQLFGAPSTVGTQPLGVVRPLPGAPRTPLRAVASCAGTHGDKRTIRNRSRCIACEPGGPPAAGLPRHPRRPPPPDPAARSPAARVPAPPPAPRPHSVPAAARHRAPPLLPALRRRPSPAVRPGRAKKPADLSLRASRSVAGRGTRALSNLRL